MKTILITGGLGYIGSHGVIAFEEAGYKTIIIDNLSNTSIKVLSDIENILGYKPDFYNLDLRNKIELEEIFKKYQFDGVLHFAGLKSVGESFEKAFLYYDNNIIGTLNLLEVMNNFNVKKIIFSSSATVYKPKININELDETGECSNPYGSTKFIIEQILRDLYKSKGFKVINLRYFNPIGAHKSGFIGENPIGIPNNLLPYVMKVATKELKEVNIFGNDYQTRDGTGIRDYIDVVDLINGHIKSYDFINSSPNDDGFFEIFNLGTGVGTSVMEIINLVSSTLKVNINYKILPRRSGDLAEVYCDPTKANKILNWKSQVSLEESIKNGYKFYKKLEKNNIKNK